jgi:hypothetical protein
MISADVKTGMQAVHLDFAANHPLPRLVML